MGERHGKTDVNEAGEEFLEFCAINHLVCKERNTSWHLDASSHKVLPYD